MEYLKSWPLKLGFFIVLITGATQSTFVEKDILSSPILSFEDRYLKKLRYALGENSPLIYGALKNEAAFNELNLENTQSHKASCFLEVAYPTREVAQWIYPASLLCLVGQEQVIWPLGELELRRAYKKGKWIMQGEVIEFFLDLLDKLADESSVQSPVAYRKIAWGPAAELEIFTLRASTLEGDLSPSLECVRTLYTKSPEESCSLFFK
jgi:hypothetical protein